MSDQITSECPAFKKGWSADIEECIGCKDKFVDEYSACKKACSKEPTPAAKPAPVETPPESKPTSKPPPSPKAAFKPFREGSRADVLLKFLIEAEVCTFDEAANHLESDFDIERAKAMTNVKDYCREWSRGKWNGKEVDLPFVVVIDDDAVACDVK